MRIAVVGAGGVGGAYGAALAKAGADVTFIARGAHLAAMKSKGLKLESPRGDIHLVPTRATDDPKAVGPVEVINLMGERSKVRINLAVLEAGRSQLLGAGIHIAYCPAGRAALRLADETHDLETDGGLRIEDVDGVASCSAGLIVLGSIACVSP